MATEETALLSDHPVHHPLPVYDRFSRQQKRVILVIVSLTGLVFMFAYGSFVPSIPQISNDLDVTPAAVGLGVSCAIFASSLGVMFWSAYTSFYGRRIMYLCGMPITIIGSFAVAASTDITSLLLWRLVQMLGCSGCYGVGAAIIGDIYKLEERGTAMGSFLGATLFGLALAPSVGGIAAQYWSWRAFHILLGFWSAIQMFLLFFFFPETAHPGTLGIDKVRDRRRLFVWINPFRCIAFLRSPNILLIALAGSFVFLTDFVLMTPISYTLGTRYGITSEALIGILFLPSGFGSFVGAFVGGCLSDEVVRRAKEQREGVWVPEDRLRATWLGGLVLVPVSVTLAGFTTAYVDGMVGLVINLVCLFANGAGMDLVLASTGTYAIDIIPDQGAELTAAVTSFRWLFVAPISALCLPAVETIGIAATNSISGILALFGYFLIWLTIRYGEQMRAYVDVGYPDFHAQGSEEDGIDVARSS